jgi:hypothetical protein
MMVTPTKERKRTERVHLHNGILVELRGFLLLPDQFSLDSQILVLMRGFFITRAQTVTVVRDRRTSNEAARPFRVITQLQWRQFGQDFLLVLTIRWNYVEATRSNIGQSDSPAPGALPRIQPVPTSRLKRLPVDVDHTSRICLASSGVATSWPIPRIIDAARSTICELLNRPSRGY